MKIKNREYINTLLNIDNFAGEHSGRFLPWLIFFAIGAVPIFLWIFIMPLIEAFGFKLKPFNIAFIIFEVLWLIRWFLITIGQEKKRIAQYKLRKSGKYKSAGEIVHLNYVYDNGVILYDNGQLAIMFGGYLKGYTSPKKMSLDFQDFIECLDNLSWDMYCFQELDYNINAELPKLKSYQDKEVINDRIQFFKTQGDYINNNGKLYKYVFRVNVSKSDWKTTLKLITELINSDVASVFNEIKVFNRDDVYEAVNRDIEGYVDINKLIMGKFDSFDLHGSKPLWFDDEIPEDLKRDFYDVVMEERRQSYAEE